MNTELKHRALIELEQLTLEKEDNRLYNALFKLIVADTLEEWILYRNSSIDEDTDRRLTKTLMIINVKKNAIAEYMSHLSNMRGCVSHLNKCLLLD